MSITTEHTELAIGPDGEIMKQRNTDRTAGKEKPADRVGKKPKSGYI